MKGLLLIVLASTTLGSGVPSGHSEWRQEGAETAEQRVECAIKDLGAVDETVRMKAKGTLIRLGPATQRKLISALRHQVEILNVAFEGVAGAELARFNGQQRVELYDLVAQLNLVEAVPYLIAVMETAPDHGGRGCDRVTSALVRIGATSVRPLVQSLANARRTAEMNSNRIDDGSHLAPSVGVDSQIIQMRAARALGDLGDIVGLPVLERLYADEGIGEYWIAIQLIKKKNRLKYERWPNGDDVQPFCSN